MKYFPNVPAEYHRRAIPSSIKQIPTKKSEVRFQDMAACGRSKESEKSIAIPLHQRTATRFREPWSRAIEESVDRLTLQETTSGSIQDAQAPQKIRAKIGPAENDKGRSCISLVQLTAYDRMLPSWLSTSSGGSMLVSLARGLHGRTELSWKHIIRNVIA